jgi:hypothetical protein
MAITHAASSIQAASSVAAPAAARGALLGPGLDFFCFGPGATVLVTAVVLSLQRMGAAAAVAGLVFGLSMLLVGPHYAATYRRAYSSLEIVRSHPWVTLAAPLLLAIAAVAAVRHPATVGLAYFGLYVGWSGYHYSGQSLGLAMLYPLRQGARLDRREKRLISLPLYVSWILSIVGLFRLATVARNPAYDAIRLAYNGPPVPAWLIVAGLAALATSFAGVAVVARERRRRGVPLPALTYAVLSAQTIWFSVGLFHPLFSVALVPMFHGLQYLALTSWHACHGREAAGPRRFAGYAVVVMLIGLLINPGLFAVAQQGGFGTDVFVASAAAASFLNLHHFLLDGRIWRLRDRRVVQSMVS